MKDLDDPLIEPANKLRTRQTTASRKETAICANKICDIAKRVFHFSLTLTLGILICSMLVQKLHYLFI